MSNFLSNSKTKRLYEFDIKEVSLVDKAANKQKFLIVKEEQIEMDKKVIETIFKSALKVEKDEKNITDFISDNQISGDTEAKIRGISRLLSSMDISSDVRKSLGESLGFVAPVTKSSDEPDEETILKNVNDDATKIAIQKLFDTQSETIRKAEAKAQEIEKKFLIAEKAAKLKESIAVAKSEYSFMPIEASEMGALLLDIKKSLNKERFENFTTVLKSLGAYISDPKSFTGVGSKASGDFGRRDNSYGKIEKIAKSLMDKDSSLTEDVAIMKAVEQNPELYAQYDKEIN